MEESKKHRIFVGNLPLDVKLTHLFSVLPPGYDESQVEIKHNYDIDKNITSSYAFVNLEGSYSDARTWCDKASKKSLGGNVILVQFAKLSFLERLKQEVNSQKPEKVCNNAVSVANIAHPHIPAKVGPNAPKISRFKHSSSEPSDDDEMEICSTDITTDKGSPKKIKLNSDAEARRIESLEGKSSAHLNQQKIIKMAINMSSKDKSNKIVFHDSDSDTACDSSTNEEVKCKLFGDSDDDEKEVFFDETKSKTKLIRTKISSTDERFRMDSKFFDDENVSGKKNETTNEEQGKLLQMVDAIIDEKNPLLKLKSKRKKEVNTTAILTRFDPLQKNHSSLIIKNDDEIEAQIKKPAKPKPFKVTKERFYEFSEDLKEQFKKNEPSNFSFMGMFGTKAEEPPTEETLSKLDNNKDSIGNVEKAVEIKKLINPIVGGIQNFFNIDDNEESECDDVNDDSEATKSTRRSWHEPLFLNLADPRLKEAIEFFNSPPEDSLPYNIIRSHLKKIVRRKHRLNAEKAKQFKTKLGNRRKFQRGKDKKKDLLPFKKKK